MPETRNTYGHGCRVLNLVDYYRTSEIINPLSDAEKGKGLRFGKIFFCEPLSIVFNTQDDIAILFCEDYLDYCWPFERNDIRQDLLKNTKNCDGSSSRAIFAGLMRTLQRGPMAS